MNSLSDQRVKDVRNPSDLRQMWLLPCKSMPARDVSSHPTVQKAVQIIESEGGSKDCSGMIDVVSSHGFRLYLK